ncbi:hypothetical protein BT96DRAFT_1005759 [Gymnopus androsaceus JB14]|uniref:F-box domain-containing protein n=1 Tax=Gymnopus androsaceus JB14 TaxID=1447944 RepID=A0A6A4GMT6_9AGAR|nr:hypothetical protein BT96DRAFT_1005759 [Gymnopus androsaceus JB14]
MHRALRIAEILHLISSCSDPPTNAATAVVCKQWSEESLRALWYEVPELKQLLGLFGTLRYDGNENKFEFDSWPTHEAWLRFEKIYQRKIRHLHHIPCDEFTPFTFSRPLELLARMKSPGPLLPNLRSLTWMGLTGEGIAEYCVMFMNDSVRTFRTASPDADLIPHLGSFLSCIQTRMPYLTYLELYFRSHMEYQLPVLNLMQKLPYLTVVVVPAFSDMSPILRGISEGIGSPLLSLTLFRDYEIPTAVINLTGIQGDGLKNLTSLRLYSSYNAASQIFRDSLHLEDIRIHSYEPASAEEIRELVSRIAQTCPQVEQITLSFVRAKTEVINRFKASPTDLVTFDDLRPLLLCTKMTWLDLDTMYPLSLDDADMELIAKSWTHLETLHLTPVPGILVSDNRKKLSFRSLVYIALHCVQIHTLHLYIDATFVPENLERISGSLAHLEEFGVGFSPIEDPAQVARALARILHPNVGITWGSTSGQWEDINVVSPDICSKWHGHWARVFQILLLEEA